MPMALAGLSPAPPAIIGRRVMPQRSASSFRQPRRGRAALDEPRHLLARQAGRGQAVIRPVPARHIEPQRSRCVRDILDHFTAQDQTQIGFREQNYSGRCKNLRLVRRDPKQLRRGESGHGLVAGRRAQGGPAFFQDTTFGSRPPVIPENAGPQRSQCRIEQRRAVHLARQADALDISQLARMIGLQGVEYRKGRIDPVRRLLLGMAGTRGSRSSAPGSRLRPRAVCHRREWL